MSVQPQPWPQPSPEIVAAVAAMYRGERERPQPVMVRDKLGEWLSDEQFAGAYGCVASQAGRLALVTIFQKAENLTDRCCRRGRRRCHALTGPADLPGTWSKAPET